MTDYGRNQRPDRYTGFTYKVNTSHRSHCRYCKKTVLRNERILVRGIVIYHVPCFRLVYGFLPGLAHQRREAELDGVDREILGGGL